MKHAVTDAIWRKIMKEDAGPGSKRMLADIALIQGDPTQRLAWACELRRKGLCVEAPLANRKRAKAFASAAEATGDPSKVLDLDKAEDRERLQELLLRDIKVVTRRVILVEQENG